MIPQRLLALLLLLAGPASAAIPPELAARAIVGEAAGAPYTVKLGVACAIRNRNTLRGVYGVTAKHNATEPPRVWREAARAWSESAGRDITGGADHFGNARDVARGTFRGLTLTVILGDGKNRTYFFRRST